MSRRQTNIQMQDNLVKKLKEIASNKSMSVSDIIEEAVNEWLKKYEGIYSLYELISMKNFECLYEKGWQILQEWKDDDNKKNYDLLCGINLNNLVNPITKEGRVDFYMMKSFSPSIVSDASGNPVYINKDFVPLFYITRKYLEENFEKKWEEIQRTIPCFLEESKTRMVTIKNIE